MTRNLRPHHTADALPRSDRTPAGIRGLVGLLTHEPAPGRLLNRLHQLLLQTTGGSRSMLFEYHPRSRVLHPTSASHADWPPEKAGPWLPDAAESTLVDDVFARAAATRVVDARRQMPNLAAGLDAADALLLPLTTAAARAGLLLVAIEPSRDADLDDPAVEAICDAFMIATELARLRRSERQYEETRALNAQVLQTLSSTLTLGAGLDVFCQGANRLMDAERTSVWIYDRRARNLVVRASSDPAHAARAARAAADDPHAAAAVALHGTRADLQRASEEGPAVVTVPLRGTRRALGTLVLEGVRADRGGRIRHPRSRERARPPAFERRRKPAAARRRDSVAAGAREYLRLDRAPGRRCRSSRPDRARQPVVRDARRAAARRSSSTGRWPSSSGPSSRLARAQTTRRRSGPARRRPSTCEIVDPRLKGPFMVTVTDLLNHDRERVGSVIVARDLTPQTRARGRARGAAAAADAVGEARGARPVRRRHRARAEQPAAGRARAPRAAARHRRVPEAAAPRGADDLPRSRPRRENRAQPAGLRRIAPAGARAGQPERRPAESAGAARRTRAAPRTSKSCDTMTRSCRACRAIRCCFTRCS